jgi:uncharacterized protein
VLKKQLELLWELQKIDLDLKGIKEVKDRYPQEMKRLEEKKEWEKERIAKEKERMDLLEKERRKKEGHLSAEQEKVKRTEGKMFEVKTNKEYQALLSEIETIKEAGTREEEEILQVMDEIEELKKDLGKRENEMAATLEKIEAEKAKLQERMAQDDSIWKKQASRRETISSQIEAKLLKLYNTLSEKRHGVSVVSIKEETCQGCFVHVPPQMFIEAQKNNALIRCPNCNRILFWEGNGKSQ